tara:strand:- start:154 stop:435 length:282 start_codon:yes stop_codon:yes gene_type:complete
MAFIKAVLIGVAVYYVIGFVSRLVAPFLIRMFFRRMSRKFEEQVKKANRSNNQENKKYKTHQKGKTIVEYEDDEKQKKKDYGGDYVDYEELQE